jgi:hypothetical protein
VSCKGGGTEGGTLRLTEFAMGMLDVSTGLLKALPEKPALSRVGSENENLGSRRQRSIAEGYGYGYNGGGGGFGIGAARGDGSVGSFGAARGDGSVGSFGAERDGEPDARSGLASPSTSVSSSGGSGPGYDTYMASSSFALHGGGDDGY